VECGYTILTGKKLILAGIYYWARNKHAEGGLQGRIQARFFPGPRGFKIHRGLWVPHPMDGCDSCEVQSHTIDDASKKTGYRLDPWKMWKHCKTLEHCKYLVAHRNQMVLNFFSQHRPELFLSDMVKLIEDKEYERMAADSRWIISEFGTEALTGKIEWLQEEAGLRRPNRFELALEAQ